MRNGEYTEKLDMEQARGSQRITDWAEMIQDAIARVSSSISIEKIA